MIGSIVEEDFFGTSTAQTIEIVNMRTQFKIHKALDKGPNYGEITVTNLAESTRSALQDKGAKVLLHAGYDVNIAQIFRGDVRTIDHERKGPDWETRIVCGDGERALLNGRVSESFAGGSKLPGIVKIVAKKLKIDVSDVDKSLANAQDLEFDQGYVAHGAASTVLDTLLTSIGYTWSVQDDKLQILPPDGANTERPILVSPATGLLDSPVHCTPTSTFTVQKTPKNGISKRKKAVPYIKVRSLLQPGLKPGGRVEIQSEKVNGIYRILKVEHVGDSAGAGNSPFDTIFEAEVHTVEP